MTWKVPYIDLGAQYQALKEPLDEAISRVMASGRYINGDETERFENAMEIYLGVRHVIACGNGYDALSMALRVCDAFDSDDVLTDEYTHISTHNAIRNAGFRIEFTTNEETQVYVPVHMNGRFNANALMEPNWTVIEDACQALGASFNGRKAGTVGTMGCFSLHPMKVLSCAGDGGFIATDNSALANALHALRNHGHAGVNSRLDNLQAAILNVKIPYLDSFIQRRREIAARYEAELPKQVKKPPAPSDGPYFDTYSSYVIGGSPEMLKCLRSKGIECFSHIRDDCVSLPIYPEMKEGHIAMVVAAVKAFYA